MIDKNIAMKKFLDLQVAICFEKIVNMYRCCCSEESWNFVKDLCDFVEKLEGVEDDC